MSTENFFLIVIVALLPISTLMLVLQKNPYHALVIRGILGAVATLIYAIFGAADVALTEALVGTMLTITLYAVAVRSSMVVRLAATEEMLNEPTFDLIKGAMNQWLNKKHCRLEILTYKDANLMAKALEKKECHVACLPMDTDSLATKSEQIEQAGLMAYQTLTFRLTSLFNQLKQDHDAHHELSSLIKISTLTSQHQQEG